MRHFQCSSNARRISKLVKTDLESLPENFPLFFPALIPGPPQVSPSLENKPEASVTDISHLDIIPDQEQLRPLKLLVSFVTCKHWSIWPKIGFNRVLPNSTLCMNSSCTVDGQKGPDVHRRLICQKV